ncbi:MAG: segregation/condensation protein A [Firmicutes bacterium]|nr:segregation/condensation protein A [Bacillota bacterium]
MLRPVQALPVKVDVFEGPLDLLLHLIEDNEIDIYDIPIARITGQYLAYLRAMEELDLEIASEFLVMAATLMEIKTRMLLPKTVTVGEEAGEADPRKELVDMLLEYKRLKQAAGELKRLAEDRSKRVFRVAASPVLGQERQLDLGDIRLFDLATRFKMILSKAKPVISEIARESFSVRQKMRYILRQVSGLAKAGALTFTRLVSSAISRREVVVTFLALLELARRRRVRVEQEGLFGEVRIYAAGAAPEATGTEG